MLVLELICTSIVLLWVVLALRRMSSPMQVLRRFFLLLVAAWIAENSCIEFYHFYRYNPQWHLFIGHVPLMIIVIWPVVVLSAWELARRLTSSRGWGVVIAAVMVLADASLMEPIAVQANLWRWLEPGLFGVPPIGLLGWALFALGCLYWFDLTDQSCKKKSEKARGLSQEKGAQPSEWSLALRDGLVLVLVPLFVHASLLALWWGALRYVNHTVPPWPVVGVVWCLSLGLTWSAWRRNIRQQMHFAALASRVPAALFFLVLLVLYGRTVPPLVFYALAFVPPYLAITPLPQRR